MISGTHLVLYILHSCPYSCSFVFIPVKKYLSYNARVVFEFILSLLYYFRIHFSSFVLIQVTFKLEPSCVLTIFVLFVLLVKGLRMIRTVIRTGNRTHTCSYLLILAGYTLFRVYLRKEPYLKPLCRFQLCSSHMHYCLTVIL